MDELKAEGIAIAIVDALNDEDLDRLGEAVRDLPFLTASSGLGDKLPRNWGFSPSNRASLPPARGHKAILAGSCSVATNTQVQRFIREGGSAYALQPIRLAADIEMQIARVLAWADACWRSEADVPVLVYSTAEPDQVSAAHAELGAARCGAIVEQAMSTLARELRPTRRWRPGGCRWRDCWHLRAGSGHPANADRPADRPGRALVLR